MIHAYSEQYLNTTMSKLAAMFELAVDIKKMDIDRFADMFASSRVCGAFEKADPVFVMGKSANELLGIVLDEPPMDVETNDYSTPAYWVGWVLAYAQWFLNQPYETLLSAYKCSELELNYFPYHEMDITKSVELIRSHLPRTCALKELRQSKNLSQNELAALSDVPLRTIKSYEQGTVDIAKAKAETLFAIARVLGCTIEDLIK